MGTRSHCETAVEQILTSLLINVGVHPAEHEAEIQKATARCVDSVFDPAWQWGKECANEEILEKYEVEVAANAASRALALLIHRTSYENRLPDVVIQALRVWEQCYITGSNIIEAGHQDALRDFSTERIGDVIQSTRAKFE